VAPGFPHMEQFEGENLVVHKVRLPDAAAGKAAVLICGFTRFPKSRRAHGRRNSTQISGRYPTSPSLKSSAGRCAPDHPGLVISRIKKGVAENKRDNFVPLLQGGAELKQFVHHHEPDDACLCSARPHGRHHGPDPWQSR
jgi:hypothetical protein